MANAFHEFLARASDDGTYRSSHIVYRDTETGRLTQAAEVRPEDLPAVLAEINTVALARVTELEGLLATKGSELTDTIAAKDSEKAAEKAALEAQLATLNQEKAAEVAAKEAELTAAQSKLQEIKGAAEAAISTPEETAARLAAIAAKVDEALVPVDEKRKVELAARIAKDQAELDALNAKG